jgi:trans-aconitate methyltransferase
MSEAFGNFWDEAHIQSGSLDKVADLICTGRTAVAMIPEFVSFPLFGKKSESRRVLDFGCGMGRNTFALSSYSENWIVVGYDNPAMISRTGEYCQLKYGKPIDQFNNVTFESDWQVVKQQKYDAVFACLVFQHIHEKYLVEYLNDLRSMTKLLVVHGRQFNDDNDKNTWKIMESQGYWPVVSLTVDEVGRCSVREYSSDVDPHCHRMNVYSLL